MSEEIRIRADIRDPFDREYTCEVSSSKGGGFGAISTQVELARLMGEVFRVLSHHLVAPPDDGLILQTFALAALNVELELDEHESAD
jgi:hypothetical protein